MKKVDTNTIVAVAALVTSVVAVFIAWDEGRLQRESQRASFLPLIGLEGSFSTTTDVLSVTLSATNRGHGVAFVENLTISVGGEVVHGWSDFSEALLGDELAATADFSWSNPEGYFQPGDRKELIRLNWSPELAPAFQEHIFGEGRAALDSFDAEACYCSVFGECWVSTLVGDLRPRKVDACPATENIIESLWDGFLESRMAVAP